MGPEPCEPADEVLGARRQADQPADGEERRDGVGIQHLSHDAVRFESRHADRAVPVAVGVLGLQVTEGVDVAISPGVELVAVPGFEVGAVIPQVGAGVAIAGDDDVSVHQASASSSPRHGS